MKEITKNQQALTRCVSQLLQLFEQRITDSQDRVDQSINLLGFGTRTQKAGAQRELSVDASGTRNEFVFPNQAPKQPLIKLIEITNLG